MKKVVFSDLDDTLFRTADKTSHVAGVAALDRTGLPASFQSPAQAAFFRWITGDALVIPVTGRSCEAFRRVALPFPGHAICSFGSVILCPDGSLHPDWQARTAFMARKRAGTMAQLVTVTGQVARQAGIDIRQTRIEEGGVPVYLSLKHNRKDRTETRHLCRLVSPHLPGDWVMHCQDSSIALYPDCFGKAGAVAFFLREILPEQPVLTIGIGDGPGDAGFMSLCDYMVTPSGSCLSRSWPLPEPGPGPGGYAGHGSRCCQGHRPEDSRRRLESQQ